MKVSTAEGRPATQSIVVTKELQYSKASQACWLREEKNSILVQPLEPNHTEPQQPALTDDRHQNPAIRRQTVMRAATRRVSPAVLNSLEQFNLSLGKSTARTQNLARLAAGGAAAVITGQQVGLFLSPLLVIAKALSAIATAKQLESETAVPCVPIFWLQTEDHDYPEIRRAWLPDTGGTLIELALPELEGSKVSVGKLSLPNSITQLQEILGQELGRFASAAEVLELVARCYQPGELLGVAFAKLLAALTEVHGLLFFDPLMPGAELERAAVFRAALEQRKQIDSELLARTALLESAGLPTQVTIRPDSPLFFLELNAGAETTSGGRHRLLWDDASDRWTAIGAPYQLSAIELQSVLTDNPERFSTSALLRPLLQDSIFPTAAYIGGPAEARYLSQIAPLYPLFELDQPLVVPRATITLLEAKTQSILDELSLTVEDLAHPHETTVARVLAERTNAWASPLELQNVINANLGDLFDKLQHNVAALDSTLLRPLEKARNKVDHDLAGLQAQYRKSCELKDQVVLGRLNRTLSVLRPKEQDQDRVITPIYFLARHGLPLLEQILASIVPFSTTPLLIRL